MRWSKFAGANGQYTPRCEDGVCALTGNRATSKLEADIFTLLDYVLGPGIQDFQVQLGNRQRRIDMLFPLTDTSALIVEYDGAHWHLSREEADREKSRAMSAGWDQYRDNIVVRIREHPLDPLQYLGVCVPRRPSPLICTRLTLFHLLHACPGVDVAVRGLPDARSPRPHPGANLDEPAAVVSRMVVLGPVFPEGPSGQQDGHGQDRRGRRGFASRRRVGGDPYARS